MRTISRDDLEALMQARTGPCVSLYMPTQRKGSSEKDMIRLKNLVSQAEARLVESGLRTPDAAGLLAPARRLLADSDFWRHQRDGLAVFLAGGDAVVHRLPEAFEPLVVVGPHFHLKPLMPLLSGDGRFYILALSQNEVRLLRGRRHRVDEVTPDDMPDSLVEALRFDEPQRHLQFHTGTAPSARGRRAAAYHGHREGAGSDEADTRLRRFLQQVDGEVVAALGDRRAPLVLAGVDRVRQMYRDVSAYPHLVDEGIDGNPEQLGQDELHARAWAIVAPLFDRARRDAEKAFRQRIGTGLASDQLGVILPAAQQGRVEVLFVAVGEQRWGAFDPASLALEHHSEARSESQDLLELAARFTIRHGGTVFALDAADVPGRAGAAAVFRYAAATPRART